MHSFKLPERFKNIKLHEYIVMPNQFHAILEILADATLVVAKNEDDNDDDGQIEGDLHEMGQPQGIAPTGPKKTLGEMIGAFESITTVEYIRGVKNNNWRPFNGKLWQRNYWEHIIRKDQSYYYISKYIVNNPMKWKEDKFNKS